MRETAASRYAKRQNETNSTRETAAERYDRKQAAALADQLISRTNTWADDLSTLSNDHNARFFDESGKAVVGWRPDSASWNGRVQNTISHLSSERDWINSVLQRYGKYYDSKMVANIRDILDSDFSSIADIARQDNDFYSHFKTEEEYDWYKPYMEIADQEERNKAIEKRMAFLAESVNMDVGTQGELTEGHNAMKRELEFLTGGNDITGWLLDDSNEYTTAEGRQAIAKVKQERLQQLDTLIAAEEAKRTPAKNSQSGRTKGLTKMSPKSDAQIAYEEEYDLLQKHLQQYENGAGKTDASYLSHPSNLDFSYYSDPKNSTKKIIEPADLMQFAREADYDTWTWNGQNNTYVDQYGNVITLDQYGNYQLPTEGNYEVTDPVGTFLKNRGDNGEYRFSGTNALFDVFDKGKANPDGMNNPEIMALHTQGNTVQAYDNAVGEFLDVLRTGEAAHWNEMNERELQEYYFLLETSGYDTAMSYVESLSAILDQRANQTQLEEFGDLGAAEKVLYNAISVPANIVGGATAFAEDAFNLIAGNEINPYSDAHQWMNWAGHMRAATASDLNELTNNKEFLATTLGDVYQAGMSGIDSLVGALTIGNWYSAVMGMNAFSSTARQMYDNGATKEQIAVGATAGGLFEMAFERISIGHFVDEILKGNTKNPVEIILKGLAQGGVEASEEVCTEIANMITDAAVMRTQSEWYQAISDYKDKGMSDSEAMWNALLDAGKDVWKAGVGGFISGGLMGGGGAAVNYVQTQNQFKRSGMNIVGADGVDPLLALAKDMHGAKIESQTKAVQKAEQKAEQRGKWNGKGYRAIGRLSNTVDSARASQNISDIAESLREKGMDKKTAKEYAALIERDLGGEELTSDERKSLRENSIVQEVLADNTSGVTNAAKRNLSHALGRSGIKLVANDTDAPVNKNAEERQFSAEESTSDEVASVGIAEIASNENGKMMLELSDGSKVAASEYVYSSSDDALVYESLQYMGVDAATANVLVKEYQSGGVSAEVYVRGISEAYAYGQLNLPLSDMSATTFAADLSEQQRSTAYKLGQVFSENKVAAEQKRIDDLKKAAAAPKKGTGKVYDESGNEYAESEQHTERQNASIRALKSLAKALKLDFYIFESYLNEKGERVYKNSDGTVEKAPNGFYDSDGKMHIDLNAGANGEGTMLRTVAHELTHFIKEWSPHKFKVLANFLAETYGKHGQNVAALVRAQQKKAKDNGRKLTFAEAYEEFVADSMQRMLTDGDAAAKIEALNRKDSEIVAKIREFFADLAAKLKAVRDSYKDVKADGFEGEFIKESLAEFDRLQQLFAEALVDASDSYNAVGNEHTKTAEKSSKESARSIVKKRKSTYNEFASLAMNWAKKADRKSGDARILYDPKRKKYVIIEALEDGYFEVAAGTYEAMEEEYEQAYTRATDEVYGNLEGAKSAEGSDLWDLQFSQNREYDDGDDSPVGSEGFQGDIAGSDQYLRGSHQGKYSDRDSDGNKLTAAQQKFFANSKVRDENGRLLVCYHGTNADFTSFDAKYISEDNKLGFGFYFLAGKKLQFEYSRPKTVYLNITNPITDTSKTLSERSIRSFCEKRGVSFEYDESESDLSVYLRLCDLCYGISKGDFLQGVIAELGIDGILSNERETAVAFSPEQIKLTTNENPTRNPDIRYSDRDQSYLQAVSSGDMQTAQKMVDEAAKAAGYTIKGHHGTVSYFNVFDRKYGNPEGDWGKGFYFTTNREDVEANYATENGADLTQKIELLADRMEWMDGYEDLDYEARLEAARKELIKGEPRVISAYLRMENPVEVGGENETYFDFDNGYDEEIDDYGEPSGKLVEFVEALQEVISEYGGREDAAELYEKAGWDGLYASSLEAEVKDLLAFLEDENDLVSNEALREAFERMGFDGIVDHTVAQKFGSKSGRRNPMVGVDEDTTHYIVFQSEQAKQSDPVTYDDNGNVIPLSERFDSSRKDIRYSDRNSYRSEETDKVIPLQKANEKAGAKQTLKYQERDLVGYERQRKVAAALAEDKAHLSEDVETRLRALLELQSKRTYGTLFTKSALSKPATDLMLAAGAQYRGDKAELIGLLHDVYSFMASGEDVTWESISEKAQPIVDWLIDHKDFRAEADPYTQQILNDIKALRLSMNAEQRQQTEILNDGMRNFLNKARGKVTFTTKGDPIDKAWKELAGKYPSIFDSEQNSADMPVRLVEIVEALKSEAWNASDELQYEFEQNRELVEQKLLAAVYEGYWNIPALKTVADRNQAKIDKLITEHKQEMSDLRAARDRKIGELTAEYRKERADLRREYREREGRKVAEIKTKYQESLEKRKEATARRELRPRLQALVLDTARWLTSPKKTETPCPDYLKAPYEKFLKSIDLSSKRKLGGGEPTLKDARVAATMNALAMVIERVQLSQNPESAEGGDFDAGYLDLPADFVENLRKTALEIEQSMLESENKAVNDMTSEELRQTILRIEQLNHAIRNMGQTYANARGETVKSLGIGTMSYLDELGVIEKTSKLGDWTVWENGLPYYMFKRFGAAGESIFEELMDGWDKLAFNAKTILDYSEKNWSQKEADTWSNDSRTVKLPSGAEIKLTTADAMLLYLESKQQESLNHLLKSKTVFRGHKKGKVTENDTSAQLSDADITFLVNEFVPKDSRQRQVADKIQWFFVHVSGEQLNEISMKRFLTRPANNPNYCPILVYEGKVPAQDTGKEQADLFRILNVSATKPRVAGANCSIIIRNVFDVFTEHTSDMARLNALGLPLLDSMKWLNYREKTTGAEGHIQEKSVRESMKNAYGNAAFSYIINLIKDINGRAGDIGDPSILKEWMRMAKTANVGNSLRVTLLQISSYPRAAMVLSDKSLVLGLTKLPQIEKAKKYCGIVLWKSFGFFDTNISRSIEEQIRGKRNIRQALIELSLKGPEYADAITLGALWNACEYEVAKSTQNKIGSEEFNEEVGKLLREVVYATQVVDSQLTRSQNMRSKSGLAQEAYAYMSEDTVTANILMEAGYQFYTEKRRTGSAKLALEKTGKHIIRASRITATASLFAVTMGALMAAWYDDDDEEFEEKFRQALKEELLLEAIPLNKIPIFSDILEAAFSLVGVGYFSTDSLHAQWLSQAVSAVNSWKSLGKGTSKSTVYNALYKTARAISSISGVSISGLMREVVSLWNNTFGAADPTLKIRKKKQSNKAEDSEDQTEDDRATSQYSTGDMNAALESGDTKQAGVIIDDLLAVKIENYLADGESKKDAETKAKSALKSALTSYWKEIYVSADSKRQYEIRLLLRSTGLYDTNDLIKMCNRWVNEARQEARKKK